MMSPDEIRNIGNVYRRLLAIEDTRVNEWGSIDNHMNCLSWLEDCQLTREAEVAFCHHQGRNPRCLKDHPASDCFIPSLVEAVNSILELFKEAPSLHPKNRYILEFYLTLDHEDMIVTD